MNLILLAFYRYKRTCLTLKEPHILLQVRGLNFSAPVFSVHNPDVFQRGHRVVDGPQVQ